MQDDRWRMSEEDRTLFDEERAKAERAYIAKILARKNMRGRTLAAQEAADPAPLARLRRS
jgi:hypothetical protein